MRDYNVFSPIPDVAKEVLEYDQHTGSLTWRHMPRCLFPTERGWKGANTKKFGKRAELKHAKGYFRICLLDKSYLAHRVAIFIHYGECPVDWQIDHINGIKTDNRAINLRIVKPADQQKNLRMNKLNTSGFNGVSWCSNRKKWVASIKVKSKRIHLGRFDKKEDAINARIEANKKYVFHPNHGIVR